MRAQIVRIGNSRGVRIPKPLLEEAGLEGDVEITVQDDALVIRPLHRPREGWAEAFQQMAEHGDDALFDGEAQQATSWDEEEWEWR